VQSSHHRRKRDTACTLNIVVETSNLWCIPVKDTPRILESKVLKVDVGARILLLSRLDESVYELVVLFAADSGLL